MCGSEYFPKSIKEKYGYDVDLNSKYYKDHEAFQVFQMLKQSNNFYSITHEDLLTNEHYLNLIKQIDYIYEALGYGDREILPLYVYPLLKLVLSNQSVGVSTIINEEVQLEFRDVVSYIIEPVTKIYDRFFHYVDNKGEQTKKFFKQS